MSYLRSLTAEDGEVRYSRTSRQTPVWVTAQAVAALSRKTLPLSAVPRKRTAPAATASTAAIPTPTATPAKARQPKRQSLPPVATVAAPTASPAMAAAARIPAAGALVAALL